VSAGSGGGRKTVLLSELRKAPVVGWFVAMSGEQKGDDFRVRDGQNTLGSSADSDIVIRDVTVSGRHASIRHKDQKFVLTDLDSTNGTFLNEASESVAREDLKDNDTVRVGDVVLKFKCL
jgi:pSer/pThr/pTyr-binding forkhead associated (FHA) protein